MVVLAGLRTLGFGGAAPIGAYSPSRSPQSEEYDLDYKRTWASYPPPRYCASIHGHCGISSQGTAVCAPKVLQYVLPRHRSSAHGYCGISSQGAAVCAPKAPQFCSRVLRYFLPRCCSLCSQGTAVLLTSTAVFPLKVLQYVLQGTAVLLTSTAVFPPKVLQYAHLRVRGMCPQGTAVPLTG